MNTFLNNFLVQLLFSSFIKAFKEIRQNEKKRTVLVFAHMKDILITDGWSKAMVSYKKLCGRFHWWKIKKLKFSRNGNIRDNGGEGVLQVVI